LENSFSISLDTRLEAPGKAMSLEIKHWFVFAAWQLFETSDVA